MRVLCKSWSWRWLALTLMVIGIATLPAFSGGAEDYLGYENCIPLCDDRHWPEDCYDYRYECWSCRDCYFEFAPPPPPRHDWRPRERERDEERIPSARATERSKETPPVPRKRPKRAKDTGIKTARRKAAERGKMPEKYLEMASEFDHTVPAIASGAVLYRKYCASCHGPTGEGDGPKALEASERMPSLAYTVRHGFRTEPEFTYAYLMWTIMEGGEPFGTDKPAFEDIITSRQAWRIIAYLRAGFPEPGPRTDPERMMPRESAEASE